MIPTRAQCQPIATETRSAERAEGNDIAMSTIVAQQYSNVIGVDTHAATHTLAVVTNAGVHLDTQTFPTTSLGMRRALSWAARRTEGDLESL